MADVQIEIIPSASPAAPSKPPLRRKRLRERSGDRFFRWTVLGFAAVVGLIMVGITIQLAYSSRLAWRTFGLSFITGRTWDPVEEVFGALPFIYGTLVSSALALFIAIPLGFGSAIFLAELAPKRVSNVCTFLVELLAAIPSVVLGLMGVFILIPSVRAVEPFLIKNLGFIPLFTGGPYGVGLLTAGLILAIMIVPYITSISRDVILSVPRSLKEGALGLGATHWETIRMVVLPYSRSAILGAVFLALGRALGETMAVTMVIGNAPKISASLLDPAYTMSAVLANEFAEATSDIHVHSLIAIAFLLLCITLLINGVARLMLQRLAMKRRAS